MAASVKRRRDLPSWNVADADLVRTVRLFIAAFVAAFLIPGLAMGAQSLIPSPYPNAGGSGVPLDPEPQGLGGPQTLIRDPYPQTLGDNAQGNPPITRRHRHQRLVPSITKRKYRVDRP